MRKFISVLFALGLLASPALAADYSTASYSQLENASDEISARLARITSQTAAARAQVSQCLTDLTELANEYGVPGQSVVNGANNLPASTAKTNLSAKLSAFLSDRDDLVTYCTDLETAVGTVTAP